MSPCTLGTGTRTLVRLWGHGYVVSMSPSDMGEWEVFDEEAASLTKYGRRVCTYIGVLIYVWGPVVVARHRVFSAQ